MRIMELNQQYSITEKDIEIFNITHIQQLFIEEYLSNGMKSTAAAKYAVDTASPEIAQKNNPHAYYGMRAKSLLESKAVAGYLDKTLNKTKASSVEDVLRVISSIMNDDNAENKDRLKGAELLLKHYGAFEKHQNARANKSLTYNNIGAMSDKELKEELKKRLSEASGSASIQDIEPED